MGKRSIELLMGDIKLYLLLFVLYSLSYILVCCMYKLIPYLVGMPSVTRAIPKSKSDWLVRKIQNREQNFVVWNSYINNCITSPHSCHPHLGICRTVTLVFVVPRQRTVAPSYAANSVSCFGTHRAQNVW